MLSGWPVQSRHHPHHLLRPQLMVPCRQVPVRSARQVVAPAQRAVVPAHEGLVMQHPRGRGLARPMPRTVCHAAESSTSRRPHGVCEGFPETRRQTYEPSRLVERSCCSLAGNPLGPATNRGAGPTSLFGSVEQTEPCAVRTTMQHPSSSDSTTCEAERGARPSPQACPT